MSEIGVVIIGRNEGDRLVSCIESLLTSCDRIVYVDSASTDASVERARSLGVEVVELDMSISFTAARARNAGAKLIKERFPKVTLLQFVDGDCMVVQSWIYKAKEFLRENTEYALVCGRRRERFPENSVYNKLCDYEWNTPVGEAKACGGDFMIRSNVFEDLGGFNPSLIAGEEPELCIRLRRNGDKIMRLDEEMTLHDANITKFGQWWKRSVRAGFAFAEGAYLYGAEPERYRLVETRRAWFWSILLPVAIVALCLVDMRFAAGFLIYPVQVFRLALQKDIKTAFAWQYALFTLLGKFPEIEGNLRFWRGTISRSKSEIIEYK